MIGGIMKDKKYLCFGRHKDVRTATLRTNREYSNLDVLYKTDNLVDMMVGLIYDDGSFEDGLKDCGLSIERMLLSNPYVITEEYNCFIYRYPLSVHMGICENGTRYYVIRLYGFSNGEHGSVWFVVREKKNGEVKCLGRIEDSNDAREWSNKMIALDMGYNSWVLNSYGNGKLPYKIMLTDRNRRVGVDLTMRVVNFEEEQNKRLREYNGR